jgi:hypothetical protein
VVVRKRVVVVVGAWSHRAATTATAASDLIHCPSATREFVVWEDVRCMVWFDGQGPT